MFGFIFGRLNAQYEWALSAENSVAVRGNFVNTTIGDYDNSALGFGGSYRWYFSKRAIEGFFAMGSADLLFWNAKTSLSDESATFIGITGEAGYKWNLGGFTIDLSGGLGYYAGEISGLDFGGVLPTVGLNLGYAW